MFCESLHARLGHLDGHSVPLHWLLLLLLLRHPPHGSLKDDSESSRHVRLVVC